MEECGIKEQLFSEIIKFNDIEVFRKFCLKFAGQIADLDHSSLRAVEQSYSILTGLAVRYCQLLVDKNEHQELVRKTRSPHWGYDEMVRDGVHVAFLKELSEYKN